MNNYGFKGALIPNLISELDKNQYINVYRCIDLFISTDLIRNDFKMNIYWFQSALIPNLLSELYKNQYIDEFISINLK